MREGLKRVLLNTSKHSFVQYGTISDHHLSDNMSCVEIFKLKKFFHDHAFSLCLAYVCLFFFLSFISFSFPIT